MGELQVHIRMDPTAGENLGRAWVRIDDGSPLAGERSRHVIAVLALIPVERFDTVEKNDDFPSSGK